MNLDTLTKTNGTDEQQRIILEQIKQKIEEEDIKYWIESVMKCRTSKEYQRLTTYYSQLCIFTALRLSRSESFHSNFLAWIFDPNPKENNHGLGDYPLRKLLELIAFVTMNYKHANRKISDTNNKLINSLIVGKYKIDKDVIVIPEFSFREEIDARLYEGRIDIYIKCPITYGEDNTKTILKIYLENKVTSLEKTDDTRKIKDKNGKYIVEKGTFITQTEKYEKALLSAEEPDEYEEALLSAEEPDEYENADVISIGVFLTPLPDCKYIILDKLLMEAKTEAEKRKLTCKSEKFIHLNYQHLHDYCLVPIMEASKYDRVQNQISEYIFALSRPALDRSGEEKKERVEGERVMALGNEQRDLLNSFCDENEELMLAVLRVLGEKHNMTELTDKVSEGIAKNSKNSGGWLRNAIDRDISRNLQSLCLADGKEELKDFPKKDFTFTTYKSNKNGWEAWPNETLLEPDHWWLCINFGEEGKMVYIYKIPTRSLSSFESRQHNGRKIYDMTIRREGDRFELKCRGETVLLEEKWRVGEFDVSKYYENVDAADSD
jgi:hypothetical protein